MLILLLGKFSFGQYPVSQSLGSDSTLVTSKGGLKGRIVVYSYADTTAANLERIRQYAGAMIFTTGANKLWYRNSAASAWVELGSSAGGVNIYNSDGTLTGDRILDGGGFDLAFNGMTNMSIVTLNQMVFQSGSAAQTEVYFDQDSILLTNGNQNFYIIGDTSSFSRRVSYTSNLGSTFTRHTLVDKNYVDSANALGWSLLGNSGTNRLTNFLGTTDDVELRTRVNNILASRTTTRNGTVFLDSLYRASLYWGLQAGEKDTGFASGNIGVGSYALFNYPQLTVATSSGGNIAIGHQSLYSFTGSPGVTQHNVSIGTRASARLTTGYRNVSMGLNAMHSGTTAIENTSIGTFANECITTGNYNTALGSNAMRYGTIGQYNTSIGAYSSLFNYGIVRTITITNGGTGYTTATVTISAPDVQPFGGVAGTQATATATINAGVITAITITNAGTLYSSATVTITGDGSGATATATVVAGSANTAVGVFALQYNETGYGNTSLGYYSGRGDGTTPQRNQYDSLNTYVGFQATKNTSSVIKYSTAIGYNAKVGASSSLVLGATGADQPNVGIGTETPARIFHTVGTVRHGSLGTATTDTTTYKPLVINSSGDILPGSFWYSSTPTFQQVLNAGSTLSGVNGVIGGGFDFDWDDMGDYSIVSDSSIGLTAQGVIIMQGQESQIILRTDSITANKKLVYTSNINGTLTTPNALVTRSLLDSLLGTVGGGGLTIGTTTIGNSATKRIPYDSAGTLSSNAQFAWDFTNKRLGVGTDAPTFAFHLYESTTNTTTAGARIENASTGDAVLHFLQSASNYSIGIDQSNSSRFYISASATLGTNNGVIIASDGKVGLNGGAPAAGVTLGAGSASAFSAPLKFTSGTINTTAEAGAMEYNGNFYLTKVNAVRYGVGGSLRVNTTDVGNVGTGVDDLMSFSVPAGTMSTNGDYIDFSFTFTFAANANNKTVRVVYGGTEIYNSTAQAQNGGSMEVVGKIIRTGATTQKVIVSVSTDGTLYTDLANYTTAAETLSGAVTLKATGEATSNDDIVNTILTVKYYPNN